MPSIEAPLSKILKSHREQKRFSLHSIHQETRIPVIYLEAMEAGNWKAFPAEVYLVGFLQKYAKYLGLDPSEMVQMYRREQEVHDSVKQDQVKKVEQVVHREHNDTFVKGVVLAILLLFVGVGWLYTVLEPDKAQKGGETSELSAAASSVHESPVPVDTPLLLSIFAKESVWVRVSSDHTLQFEGFLTAASSRTYRANESLQLRIGNVHALELTLNDRKIDATAGAVQGVGELQFTRADLPSGSLPHSSASKHPVSRSTDSTSSPATDGPVKQAH